jgi:general secretion pathway protein G
MHGPANANLRRRRRAFSLLEMMLVVLIMGLLMGVVVYAVGGNVEKTKLLKTKAALQQIKQGLYGYSGQYGSFPPSEMGLMPLTVGATKELDKVPKDGWDNQFVYVYPGTSGNPDRPFDLRSPGRDKQAGTQDDVDVWTMDDPGAIK